MSSRHLRAASVLLAFLAGATIARAAEQGAAERTAAEVAHVVEIASSDNRVMEHLDHLTNKIGARLTGSHGLAKAYDWTRSQFERFGLSNAHCEVWGEYAVGFDRAGPSTGRIISDEGQQALTLGSYAWTAGTDGPVRGPALWEPRTLAEVEKAGERLHGAWLVQRPGRGGAARDERDKVRKACDAAGIAGRVRGSGDENVLTDGSPRGITMQKLPTRVSVEVTRKGYLAIKKLLDAGERCELELDVKNVFFEGPVQHKNVVADLPGTEKPDEYVIVGGHLDSWDGATGTQDNGTGVATTLEAARLLVKAGVHPRRTIRFVLWSGEEQGLLGSAGFVKAHKDELPRISCVLVHDGGTNYVSGLGATRAMMPHLQPALAPLAKLDADMPFKLHQVRTLPVGVGSDHDTFLSRGVPGFFWDQAGKSDYDRVHHTQFDTFDSAVPEYQRHSAVTIAVAALAIANLDELLPRDGMLPEASRPSRKMLGVQTSPELVIESVVDGSLAEKAELQEGDRITSIGGKPVSNLGELRAAVQAAEGETEVRFVRDEKELSVKVVFESPKGRKRWL